MEIFKFELIPNQFPSIHIPSFLSINFPKNCISIHLRNILKLDKIETNRLNSLSRDVDPHSGSRASSRVRGRTRDASKASWEGEGVVRPSCEPGLRSQTTRDHICRICTFHASPIFSPTFPWIGVFATFLQPV